MPIKVASAKNKGRNLQKWVRDLLLSLAPTLESDDIKSTAMGSQGEDVQLSPAARKVFPVSIECKARKSQKTIYDWIAQAQSQGKGEPVVVIKQDRSKPLVIVDAEYFFKEIKRG